ncbi:MAG: hypothetical protein QGG36_10210 [Pirellulaceae bacterium]|jgi:hypothetical protein|nr:hypothetical protein [Pirellulaceae bacterium]MDP7016164.1 hypothetical protein [Pirellulaceae bacterium]
MSNLDDFLRQAASRRANRKGLAPAAPPNVEIVEDAEIVYEAEEVLGGDLASRTDFDSHTDRLGEQVAQADDVMDAHLHEVFDHSVGSIRRSQDGGDRIEPAPPSPADDDEAPAQDTRSMRASIIERLRNPADLRQAILLSEIINPPTDRW